MDILRKLEREKVRVYSNAKETGRLLGIGSFGSVVELAIKGVGKFAGKKIHQALVIDGDESVIVKECKLMSELIHPNIAKFCGVCMLPSYPIPVLVVELMDHSLEEIVENTKEALSYKVALSIFIDVAHGLAYLHGRSPSVLHRDLTARNVLLDKSFNAKITDFGNSKIVDAVKVSKTMTQTPGALVYMAPEAMQGHSRYGDRLDIFSFGHLGLYTIIREFPRKILPPTYYNDEGAFLARSEVQRRGEYMEKLATKLPKGHNLYPLIEQCLHNDPLRRPTAIELLHWLQDIQRLELEDLDEAVVYHGAASQITDQRKRMTLQLRDRKLDINNRQEEDTEYSEVSPATNKKTGLIEKKSAGIRKEWKAYSFEINHTRGIFKYKRPGPFGKSPHIRLEDITEVRQTSTDAGRYHFEVHFRGRNSPWELCVYSQTERQQWIDVLNYSNEQSKNEIDDTHCDIQPVEAYYECIDTVRSPNARRRKAASIQQSPGIVPKNTESELHEKMFRAFKEKLDDVFAEKESPGPGLPELVPPALPLSQTVETSPKRVRSPLPPPTLPPLSPPPVETQASVDIDLPEPRETYQQFLPLPPPSPQSSRVALPPPPPVHVPPARMLPPRPKTKMTQIEDEDENIYEDLSPPQELYEEQLIYDLPWDPTPSPAVLHQPPKPPPVTPLKPPPVITPPPPKPLPVVAHPPCNPSATLAYPPPKPSVTDDTDGTDLELLEKKTLSIPLSALSEMEKIGEGQFGEVYRAQMGSTAVAVKIVKQYSSKKVMEQFEREMTIMSQVSHTNIVTLFGIIREGPFSPALVMEFLPFGNLKIFLKREKQTEDFLIKCMIDVAMGMHYLGERGLIHRDLAARNVLVDREKRCKVADFGLLREVPKEKECVYFSKGDGNSPLRWMAPESITDNIFSPASDVWSYGILQWEMFHPNKNPYPDMNITQMIARVTTGYRLAIPDGCPPLVASIMRACWHHNPKDRPLFLRISNLLIRRDSLPIE